MCVFDVLVTRSSNTQRDNHNFVVGHFLPYIMILFLYLTKQQWCLNNTVHPASHNCITESRVLFFKPGKICPIRADCGKQGQLMSHSCEACSVVPSGIITERGFLAGRLLLISASI